MVDWIILWRDIALILAWIVVIIFLISGVEDLIYDIGLYCWKIIKRLRYRKRPVLTLNKMSSRLQQRIAIFIPAWDEGNVIDMMVENTIKTVEYRNYYMFIGAYPNDPATNQSIDRVSAKHPNVIKVTNSQPGPTTKADCLNAIYRGMRDYETANNVNFDIIVMHDAEDVVHPYSLLLYNYLLPRIDAIQLPILPLPVSHGKIVPWSYADEFAENHMKDMIVREHINGLVPFAGVGTGFSRRAFMMLENEGLGNIFNTITLTEDYNFGNTLNKLGLKSIFVNVLLKEHNDSIFVPLSRRRGFIANWAYFPESFKRAVRQKTRWILGISLQEWELSGWKGKPFVKLSLFKDRKVVITSLAAFLAYIVLAYVIVSELGARGYIATTLIPIIYKGTPLYFLVLIATCMMLIRIIERIIFVTMVYGITAGILSFPRLIFGNILNGFSTFNALTQYLKAHRNNHTIAWDKTQHYEGVGSIPASTASGILTAKAISSFSALNIENIIDKSDPATIISEIEAIPSALDEKKQKKIVAIMSSIIEHDDYTVRAAAARVIGFLRWEELYPLLIKLLSDSEWLIRANAARSLFSYPDLVRIVEDVIQANDRYAQEAFIRTAEQYTPIHKKIEEIIKTKKSKQASEFLITKSPLFNKLFNMPGHQ